MLSTISACGGDVASDYEGLLDDLLVTEIAPREVLPDRKSTRLNPVT
jgi:hypothetical protein